MNIIEPWRFAIDRLAKPSGIVGSSIRVLLAAGLCAGSSCVAADSLRDAELKRAGERIYHEGISTTIQPILAKVEGDVAISGKKVACIICHQRSGLGSSEAATLIPPIAGSKLFSPRDTKNPFQASMFITENTSGGRPAYTLETLSRALRQGVDSNGRTLAALMPRYELSDNDVEALSAYLNSLAAAPDPGVDEATIHFASVVMPDASTTQRNAMLDVLETYFQDRNSATRHETRRAEHAPWNKQWSARSYRKWKLHVWELTGPASSWPDQLEKHYRKQPVFALLGGVGASEWSPVHRFCEQYRVPCVFPSTDLPAANESGIYSLYFSKGVLLEAETLATYLSPTHKDINGNFRIAQVFRNDVRGIYASRAFRSEMQNRGFTQIDDLVIDSVTPSRFHELAHTPSVIMYWLDANDLHAISKSAPTNNEHLERYFSSTLIEAAMEAIPAPLRDRGHLLHPFALNEKRQKQLMRTNLWLKSKNISITDQRIQADAYFVATLTSAAVHKIQGNFSRDYFIERIEHMVENTLSPSIYPRLSLGPGQRFASKGCYIVDLSDTATVSNLPVWITP
jgi:mono/diheme cytochrome c family protein